MFDVTAVLVTSTTLGSVVEVSGVPVTPTAVVAVAPLDRGAAVPDRAAASPATARAATSLASAVDPAALPAALGPAPFIGPQPAQKLAQDALERIPTLRGTTLLAQLSLLQRDDLATVLGDNPKLVPRLLSSPPPAAAVATWWRDSSTDARRSLIAEAPQLVGALEGIPYTQRSTANKRYLDEVTGDIRTRLQNGVGRAKASELTTRLHMLEQVREALTPADGGAQRQLVSLDPRGDGTAVIVVGDLQTADDVSFLVPGMFYGVDARIVPWTTTAADLQKQQGEWLKRLGRGDETSAVVSWIGYETPTLVNVAAMDNARAGQKALTASLRGLAAARDDHPYVSVLAHSYGTTAAMLSLSEDDVTVDSLAMVGSPGGPVANVRDLAVRDGVWVGAAPWDPIGDAGVFGNQPRQASFGATKLGVDGAHDPITESDLTAAVSHNDYFTVGGESLRNLALVGIGEGARVIS
nr:alpha/beta hydrolase [Schumannella luteola]